MNPDRNEQQTDVATATLAINGNQLNHLKRQQLEALMLKSAHRTALLDSLGEVYDTGFCRIEYRKLYRWFETERITIRVFREMVELWEEEIIGPDAKPEWKYRLGFLSWDTLDAKATLSLVCLDPEGTPPEDMSFQPLLDAADMEKVAGKRQKTKKQTAN